MWKLLSVSENHTNLYWMKIWTIKHFVCMTKKIKYNFLVSFWKKYIYVLSSVVWLWSLLKLTIYVGSLLWLFLLSLPLALALTFTVFVNIYVNTERYTLIIYTWKKKTFRFVFFLFVCLFVNLSTHTYT